MRIRRLRVLSFVVVRSLGMAAKAAAPLSASVMLSTLVSTADVIVVGPVTGSAPSEVGPYSIEVDRVLKGTPGARNLPFRGKDEPLFHPAGVPMPYGMMFLKRPARNEGEEGQWIALGTSTRAMMLREHVLPAVPGGLPADASTDDDATMLDAIVGEIRHAVASGIDADRLSAGYHALMSLQFTRETDVAHPHSQTMIALQTTGTRLAKTIRDRQIAGEPVPGTLTMLLWMVKDSEAVPDLGALLTSPISDSSTKRGALHALRAIHSESSLPFLAAALESDDPEVAYDGMMGLSSYALGFPPGETRPGRAPAVSPHRELSAHSPSIALFETNPDRYLEYWRGWWKCQACRLGRPECVESMCTARRGYRPN